MMKNVKMDYLYRDAGNYKLRDAIIFRNEHKLTIEQVVDLSMIAFIDNGRYFDPEHCTVPRLSFDHYDPELDHAWHEVEAFSLTDEIASHEADIADFLLNALKANQRWKFPITQYVEYVHRDGAFR